MFKKIGSLSALFFLLFVAFSFAQSEEEIIKNFIKKQKEYSDTSKIKNLYMELSVSTMGFEVPSKIWKKGNNYRAETSFMGQNSVVVIADKEGWSIQNGMTTEIPADQLDMYRAQIANQTQVGNLNISMEDYEKEKDLIKVVGMEKIDGVNCYHIQINPSKDNTQQETPGHFWFDPKNHTLIKMSFKTAQNGQEQQEELLFKDYEFIKGVPFPKNIDIYMDSQKNAEIKFQKILVNEPIDDNLFKK
jgi:outer membrane lipoprotein-sorting protein